MLYLFTGSDGAKVRERAFAWVAAARRKQPDVSYLRLSPEQITAGSLAEASSSQGLFFKKLLVLLDDPFSMKESGTIVAEHLPSLSESENPVALIAPRLLAAQKKKIETLAHKIFIYDERSKKTAPGFNALLVNALASKNKETLWLELMRARRAGDAPEMLHGLLHWKARDLMEKGSARWKKEDARTLSCELIELLSDSRSGELSLGENLERFVLSIPS